MNYRPVHVCVSVIKRQKKNRHLLRKQNQFKLTEIKKILLIL